MTTRPRPHRHPTPERPAVSEADRAAFVEAAAALGLTPRELGQLLIGAMTEALLELKAEGAAQLAANATDDTATAA